MSSAEDHMVQPVPSGGYSTNVRIALHVNGRRIRVAKMGPQRLYLEVPQVIPERTGQVVMHVDQNVSRWRVTLQPTDQPSRVIQARFEAE